MSTEQDPSAEEASSSNPSWDRILIARHPKRPYSRDYIDRLMPDFSEVHGDRLFGDDQSTITGFATFEGRPVMIIGQQKGRSTKEKVTRNFGMPKPEGYRKAIRAMQMANKFGRPIITFIDTPGAFPGVDAEERGQAESIAYNLREMSRLRSPVVSVVIGEGGSGGALGIGIANRIYMLENAYYSVIPPEGCAAIIWRDASKAPQAAAALKPTAQDLLSMKLIDGIIPEPKEGAHVDIDGVTAGIRETLLRALDELSQLSPEQMVQHRYDKFRQMGNFFETTAP